CTMNASLQIDFQLLGTTLPTYDDQGRLSAVTDEAGTPIARYAYNALGQRVLKEVQQGTARTPYTYLYGPRRAGHGPGALHHRRQEEPGQLLRLA
ncbi:RHS repeat protein, partial [Escherichia coli]|uniref:RHS repeat domain-containing protein n=1 Tax=Escherichia coli TaxID=562 RepID=UPI0022838260